MDAIKITFITPCFCRGADCSDDGRPEIRPASIRGQLRWWFRALGGIPEDEKTVFGGVHGEATASKLVVRVKLGDKPAENFHATLPHKQGGRAASKKAFSPGTSFELLLSWRLGGVDAKLRERFDRALEAWLHLGALGLRATRGGGNFRWEGQPGDPGRYAERVRDLTKNTEIVAGLLNGKVFPNAEAARKVITDTLDEEQFSGFNRPLGGIKKPRGRKASPLRFRVMSFDDGGFRIAAVWDGREKVTGNKEGDLRRAIDALTAGGKGGNVHEIGGLLKNSGLYR